MPDQYYDELDQEAQQASSGGGIVCQIAIYGAFQVYAAGVTPAERIFLYGGALKKADALAKAEALAAGGNVEQTFCTVQYKDSVLGRDVGHWKGDRFHTYGPHWADDAQEFNKLRVALGIKAAQKTWVRMGSMTSPNCEKNKDKTWAWEDYEGEKRLKRLNIPVAVFVSKADAEAAAASTAVASTVDDPSYPGAPNWVKYEDWVTVGKPMVREMAAAGKPQPLIAKECACSIEQVKFVLSEPAA